MICDVKTINRYTSVEWSSHFNFNTRITRYIYVITTSKLSADINILKIIQHAERVSSSYFFLTSKNVESIRFALQVD